MSCKTTFTPSKYKSCRLWTDVDTAVDESLLGFATIHRGVVILEGCRAILRRDYNNMQGKVKLMSGGSAGNEPAHIGFVGPGMLTAAITGDIFSAPPSNAILSVIEEIGTDHQPGVLLIVQNFTGYRINFGLAKLRAQSKGLTVKMVVVEDDVCTNSFQDASKRRGLAAVLFVHKVAGAMAEAKESLDAIYNICNKMATKGLLLTIGACIKPSVSVCECTCQNETLAKLEFGCGIHGEAGFSHLDFMVAKDLATIMVDTLIESFRNSLSKEVNIDEEKTMRLDNKVAVIINNLGGCSQIECHTFMLQVFKQLKLHEIEVQRIYMGSLMTSLDACGFHVSLLNLSVEPVLTKYLDAPTSAPAWPKIFSIDEIDANKENSLQRVVLGKHYQTTSKYTLTEIVPQGPTISDRTVQIFLTILIFACDALIACTEQLNIMDADSGDGDCGTTIARGANSIKEAIKGGKIMATRPFVAFSQIARTIEKVMGGLQGALYSLFFDAAAKAFAHYDATQNVTPFILLSALSEANDAISEFGRVSAGDRSMLDPLLAAQRTLENALNSYSDPICAFGSAVSAAENAAMETLHMQASCGRASLIKTKPFKYPDPGAHAVGIWMRAAYEGAKLKLSCRYETK